MSRRFCKRQARPSRLPSLVSLNLRVLSWLVLSVNFSPGLVRAGDDGRLPCFVSTWSFGRAANERAMSALQSGADVLDALEQGIRLTEADANNASVGLGGTPNANGVVQLDACIMDGRGHRAGSVAALEGMLHPISVARLVMDKSRHVMLVGEGAHEFAVEHGAEQVELLTKDREQAWRRWQAERKAPAASADNHDTIAMVGVDAQGNVVGGCSTSGMGYKLAGRVGDSPILGSGLYVDNEVGGAGATGVGENVMRYCGSFMIVEAMRHGMSPQQACEAAIRRIDRIDPQSLSELHINFVAVNRQGQVGAAGTDRGFEMAVSRKGRHLVVPGTILSE